MEKAFSKIAVAVWNRYQVTFFKVVANGDYIAGAVHPAAVTERLGWRSTRAPRWFRAFWWAFGPMFEAAIDGRIDGRHRSPDGRGGCIEHPRFFGRP